MKLLFNTAIAFVFCIDDQCIFYVPIHLLLYPCVFNRNVFNEIFNVFGTIDYNINNSKYL